MAYLCPVEYSCIASDFFPPHAPIHPQQGIGFCQYVGAYAKGAFHGQVRDGRLGENNSAFLPAHFSFVSIRSVFPFEFSRACIAARTGASIGVASRTESATVRGDKVSNGIVVYLKKIMLHKLISYTSPSNSYCPIFPCLHLSRPLPPSRTYPQTEYLRDGDRGDLARHCIGGRHSMYRLDFYEGSWREGVRQGAGMATFVNGDCIRCAFTLLSFSRLSNFSIFPSWRSYNFSGLLCA